MRVINDSGLREHEALEGVPEAIRGPNYRPNHAANRRGNRTACGETHQGRGYHKTLSISLKTTLIAPKTTVYAEAFSATGPGIDIHVSVDILRCNCTVC